MISLALVLLLAQEPEQAKAMMQYLPNPAGKEPLGVLRKAMQPLDPPKSAPKVFTLASGRTTRFQFPWLTSGFARPTEEGDYNLKFRVYSQERKAEETFDLGTQVARMSVRMWNLLNDRFKFDHPPINNVGSVDIYLCWGGQAGGEQLIGDERNGQGDLIKVNTIYIYDITSFSEPVEMAREVAHEYGHAVLPAVGGFESPEDWANGYLGERMFLRWIRDEMVAKRLTPQDAMGASFEDLDFWVKSNVDALVESVLKSGPDNSKLAAKGQGAMDHYMGLILSFESVYPTRAAGRAMKLNGSNKASGVPDAIVAAAGELAEATLKIPSSLAGRPMWIPLGKGTIANAKVLARNGGWAQIQSTGLVRIKQKLE